MGDCKVIHVKGAVGFVFLFLPLIMILQGPKDQGRISGMMMFQNQWGALEKTMLNECNWYYEVDWWGSGRDIYANYEIHFQAPPPGGFSPFDVLVKWRVVNTIGQPVTNL